MPTLEVPEPEPASGDPFAQRPLPRGEVHVWHANLDAAAAFDRTRSAPVLSADEVARAERMLGKAKARFMRSRELLRRALACYSGERPDAFRIEAAGGEGKPRLVPDSMRFNLAHTGPHWLAAFAVDREVGVDVERIDRNVDRDRVAARIFSPGEVETIRHLAGDAKTAAFFRAWATREAVVKARGEGMFTLASRFEVDADPEHPLTIRPLGAGVGDVHVGLVPTSPGCVAVLATEGRPDRIRAWSVA